MNEIATQSAIAELDTEGKSALATLPTEWIKPVGFFCLAHLGLLRTRGPLCANLKLWIKNGLTLDEGMKIMQRLLDPEVAQHFHFENQLMAEFRASVARLQRHRRIQREAEMRRTSVEQPQGEAGTILNFAEATRFTSVDEHGRLPPVPSKRVRKDRRA